MNDPHYGQIFLQAGPTTKVQWFICAFTQSPAFHVGMGIGNGLVISAQPGGARIEPEAHYEGAMWSQFPINPLQAEAAVEWVKLREGRPYNWIDDAMIGIESVSSVRFPRWMTRHWDNDKHYQCAQLVDAAYTHGGCVQVFNDGREPGRVSPASFGQIFQANGWWTHSWAQHRLVEASKF